jgi:hypothetical protein
MTSFPQLSNFLFSPRHRRGLSRFSYALAAALVEWSKSDAAAIAGDPYSFSKRPYGPC